MGRDKTEWIKTRYSCHDLTVSNKGHINYEGTFLRQWGEPYKKVRIMQTNYRVHSIIAKAFCGGYKKGLVVNHKDGNKKNNHASNLEHCTSGDNVRHAHRTGLIQYPKRKKIKHMAYKTGQPTVTSKYPIEVPTHEYYSNFAVYKIWFGTRFFIWKGKSFSQSVETISVMIDRARRLHYDDKTNFLHLVVKHIIRNRVTKGVVEIMSIADFDDTDWLKFLKDEQNLLTAHMNNELCLNNNFVAHVPKWMGQDITNEFNEWLKVRHKPKKKATSRKKDVHAQKPS
jgi:hypothetical protein